MKTTIKSRVFSAQTRNNLLLDMQLLISGIITALSGIYFLFLPVGGYQGGRNPFYGITIIFERHSWNDIHIWASVALISLAALHIPLHWEWITKMTKSGFRSVFGKSSLNKHSQFNLAVNVLIGLSGLLCGISGLYFLLVPGASHASLVGDPGWIFSRVVWDLIHTWSGVVMITAGLLHFGIHWKWVVKVVSKYWSTLEERITMQQSDQTIEVASITARDI